MTSTHSDPLAPLAPSSPLTHSAPIKLLLKKRTSTSSSSKNDTCTSDAMSDSNAQTDSSKFVGGGVGGNSIKLNLIRKPTISPLLSIQSYIYENIRNNNPVDNIRELWDKFQKQSIYSSLIQIHNLDFDIFKDIAMTILNSITPYQITITPDTRYDMGPRLSNNDLIDFEL
ncbi:MAG: hypothetical protein WD512_02625 [Candidatus Paceibacterota bacterium]